MIDKRPPLAVFAVFVVLGAVVTLAMLAYVVAGLRYGSAAYITALTLDVIMQQP